MFRTQIHLIKIQALVNTDPGFADADPDLDPGFAEYGSRYPDLDPVIAQYGSGSGSRVC